MASHLKLLENKVWQVLLEFKVTENLSEIHTFANSLCIVV